MTKIYEQLHALRVDINSIEFDPDNARTHSVENLAAIRSSLLKFGQRKPIVVQNFANFLYGIKIGKSFFHHFIDFLTV